MAGSKYGVKSLRTERAKAHKPSVKCCSCNITLCDTSGLAAHLQATTWCRQNYIDAKQIIELDTGTQVLLDTLHAYNTGTGNVAYRWSVFGITIGGNKYRMHSNRTRTQCENWIKQFLKEKSES